MQSESARSLLTPIREISHEDSMSTIGSNASGSGRMRNPRIGVPPSLLSEEVNDEDEDEPLFVRTPNRARQAAVASALQTTYTTLPPMQRRVPNPALQQRVAAAKAAAARFTPSPTSRSSSASPSDEEWEGVGSSTNSMASTGTSTGMSHSFCQREYDKLESFDVEEPLAQFSVTKLLVPKRTRSIKGRLSRWRRRGDADRHGDESYASMYARLNENAERLESERRLLEIERHKAIRRMREEREEHLGGADAYRRLQSLSVEEDADAAEEWDGNEDIRRKEEEIEGLKRRMEEMEQLRLEQDEKDDEFDDNEDDVMEDDCRTVSEEEEEEVFQDEKEEELASESESESSQSTAPEMDQISMCEPPSPAVSHVERQLETRSTAKLRHLLSLGLSASFESLDDPARLSTATLATPPSDKSTPTTDNLASYEPYSPSYQKSPRAPSPRPPPIDSPATFCPPPTPPIDRPLLPSRQSSAANSVSSLVLEHSEHSECVNVTRPMMQSRESSTSSQVSDEEEGYRMGLRGATNQGLAGNGRERQHPSRIPRAPPIAARAPMITKPIAAPNPPNSQFPTQSATPPRFGRSQTQPPTPPSRPPPTLRSQTQPSPARSTVEDDMSIDSFLIQPMDPFNPQTASFTKPKPFSPRHAQAPRSNAEEVGDGSVSTARTSRTRESQGSKNTARTRESQHTERTRDTVRTRDTMHSRDSARTRESHHTERTRDTLRTRDTMNSRGTARTQESHHTERTRDNVSTRDTINMRDTASRESQVTRARDAANREYRNPHAYNALNPINENAYPMINPNGLINYVNPPSDPFNPATCQTHHSPAVQGRLETALRTADGLAAKAFVREATSSVSAPTAVSTNTAPSPFRLQETKRPSDRSNRSHSTRSTQSHVDGPLPVTSTPSLPHKGYAIHLFGRRVKLTKLVNVALLAALGAVVCVLALNQVQGGNASDASETPANADELLETIPGVEPTKGVLNLVPTQGRDPITKSAASPTRSPLTMVSYPPSSEVILEPQTIKFILSHIHNTIQW